MGNTNSHPRGDAVSKRVSPTADPFAELAEIFETELRHDPRFVEPQATRTTLAPRLDPSDDFGFAMPGGSHNASAARGSGFAGGLDHELEAVLRNLSAPARPRDRAPVEAQSFAPERPIEERMAHPQEADADEFEELIRSELAILRPDSVAVARQGTALRNAPGNDAVADTFDAAFADAFDDQAFGYGVGDAPTDAVREPVRRAKRSRMLASVGVAALLLSAGAGYLLLPNGLATGNGGQFASGDPLLIKADSEPFKVTPKDPGGRAYPNQNKAVYERVASPAAPEPAPTQQTLNRNAEEPVDLPTDSDGYADDLPGVQIGDMVGGDKDETRVTDQTEVDNDETVLQPRRVRTSRVGPDGRLVQDVVPGIPSIAAVAGAPEAPTPTPDVAQSAPSVASASLRDTADAGDAFGIVQLAAPAPVAPMREATPAPAPEPEKIETASLPASKPAKSTASPPTAAAAVPAGNSLPDGGWFVQVSSSASPADAQQSMRNVGRRFGSLVGDRPIGIQSAEISGKGTYHRVRIAVASKSEAGELCSRLQGAGGSCFVTR